jgi:hypothetical protein
MRIFTHNANLIIFQLPIDEEEIPGILGDEFFSFFQKIWMRQDMWYFGDSRRNKSKFIRK